jgi:hypothetical protein
MSEEEQLALDDKLTDIEDRIFQIALECDNPGQAMAILACVITFIVKRCGGGSEEEVRQVYLGFAKQHEGSGIEGWEQDGTLH